MQPGTPQQRPQGILRQQLPIGATLQQRAAQLPPSSAPLAMCAPHLTASASFAILDTHGRVQDRRAASLRVRARMTQSWGVHPVRC